MNRRLLCFYFQVRCTGVILHVKFHNIRAGFRPQLLNENIRSEHFDTGTFDSFSDHPGKLASFYSLFEKYIRFVR